MLNRITLQGRLCADPELRRTQSGTAVATVNLAVERDFSDKSGNRATDFISCVAWGKSAEFWEKYLAKGQMVIVSGRLQIRGWEDKDGHKRKTAEVNVDNTYFCGSKGSTAKAPEDVPFEELNEDDSDLPF